MNIKALRKVWKVKEYLPSDEKKVRWKIVKNEEGRDVETSYSVAVFRLRQPPGGAKTSLKEFLRKKNIRKIHGRWAAK